MRSCRLIVGEWVKLDQKKIKNRLILTVPLFAAVIGISLWNFLSPANFNVLWRWFAWSNQALAAISLWVATGYLYDTKKSRFISLFTAIPAMFMTTVVVTYLLAEPRLALGRFVPYNIAIIVGISISLLVFGFYVFKLITKRNDHLMDVPSETKSSEID